LSKQVPRASVRTGPGMQVTRRRSLRRSTTCLQQSWRDSKSFRKWERKHLYTQTAAGLGSAVPAYIRSLLVCTAIVWGGRNHVKN